MSANPHLVDEAQTALGRSSPSAWGVTLRDEHTVARSPPAPHRHSVTKGAVYVCMSSEPDTTMRFLDLKSEKQLELQTLHRARDRLVGVKTALCPGRRSLGAAAATETL